MTIRLHTLGQSCIEVGTIRIGPESERLFALLLYLAVERGKQVSRTELRRLLWPEADATHSTHSLRQLIYRARRMGVAIETDRFFVKLNPQLVELDFTACRDSAPTYVAQPLESACEGFLPGYAPDWGDAYRVWLDRLRDSLHASLRRLLIPMIHDRKSHGDWRAVESLSSQCLQLDPLNEEATLARAEAAAIMGSKALATRILDDFLNEIGPGSSDLTSRAKRWRKRIIDLESTFTLAASQLTPFVGRETDFRSLNLAMLSAERGSGSTWVVVGEPGIGKSRLVTEFARHAALSGARCIRLDCQPQDRNKPMSLFVDLAPKLLGLPGVLGCSPATIRLLKRLSSFTAVESEVTSAVHESELLYRNVCQSVLDALDAVSGEACLTIIAEDIHWADSNSRDFIVELAEWCRDRALLIILTTRDSLDVDQHLPQNFTRAIRLAPLSSPHAQELLDNLFADKRMLSQDFVSWCLRLGAGNPLHLIELANQRPGEDGAFTVPHSLSMLIAERLSLLSRNTLRLLQACSILGKHSTLRRLDIILGVPALSLLDSLDEAESHNLVEFASEHVLIRHELVRAAVFALMSVSTRRLLHTRAAHQLDIDAIESSSASLLWESAEHWMEAGATERAVAALRTCARHSLELGLPLQACGVLERALSLAGRNALTLPLIRERIRALQLGEAWSEVASEVSALRRIVQQEGQVPETHDDLEVLLFEARWNDGVGAEELLPHILECVRGPFGDTEHKQKALVLGMLLVTNCHAELEGKLLLDAASACAKTKALDPRSWLLVRYAYELTFGDLAIAVSCARQCIDLDREQSSPAWLSRTLRNSSLAFHQAGQTQKAIELAEESLQVAENYGLFSTAFATAIRLADFCLDTDRLDQAEVWLQKAAQRLDQHSSPMVRLTYHCDCAELALRVCKWRTAEEQLSLAVGCENSGNLFMRIRFTALASENQMLAHATAPSDESLQKLLAIYDRVRSYGNVDLLVLTICRGLFMRNEQRERECLFRDYSDRHRRDLFPIPWELAALGR
ncbi:MAG: ATP-binding protein [Gemmatimonadaceae bacterium]